MQMAQLQLSLLVNVNGQTVIGFSAFLFQALWAGSDSPDAPTFADSWTISTPPHLSGHQPRTLLVTCAHVSIIRATGLCACAMLHVDKVGDLRLQAAAGKEARAEAESLLGQLKGAQTDLSRTQQRLDKEQAAGEYLLLADAFALTLFETSGSMSRCG